MWIEYDPNHLLWQEMSRLRGIEIPRIVRREATLLPATERKFREQFMILGQEEYFHGEKGMEAVLDTVKQELSLTERVWRDQRPFFKDFFCSFFRAIDGPAWVNIHPLRPSFQNRVAAQNGCVSEQLTIAEPIVTPKLLERYPLLVNGIRLPMKHLSLAVDGDYWGKVNDYALYEVRLHRRLAGDGFEPPLNADELWYCLGPMDRHRRTKDARSPANPWGEKWRDPTTKIQRSPLVSLTRLDNGGKRAISRVFSVTPMDGRVVDIRTCVYTAEYYFRSDMATHTMLESLLVPGRYDRF
jgi:hypothetical protein